MEFAEWLTNTPKDFPLVMSETKVPPNHNPFIGTDQRHTIDKVRDVLQFIRHIIARTQRNELELDADETNGLYHIVDACSSALRFEILCRPDSDDDKGEDSEETAV